MTTNVVLPVFVADSTLNRGGVELTPVVVDSALDGTQLINLPEPLINSSTRARSLALPQIEPVPDGIGVTLPLLTVDMTEPYGNINGATLPLITAAITVPFSSATISAYLGGIVLTDGFDEDENPIIIETQGTIRAEFSDGVLSGTIGATLPAISAIFPVEQYGELGVTLPRTTAAFETITSTLGELGVSLPMMGVGVTGGVFELSAALPLLEGYLSSTNTSVAQISADIPLASFDAVGIVTAYAEVGASVPTLGGEITGLVGQVAVVDAAMRAPTTSLNAILGASASLESTLTYLEALLTPAQQVSATLAVTLPTFEFSASAYVPVTQVATYVVDTMNNALSTYEAFPFNSFAEINGKYYGASAAGLFELVGDKDAGTTNITGVITTGHLHFGSEMQKRVSDFFIAMRAAGDITLTVTTDENQAYEYTLSPLDIETLKQRRSLIGKGAKGKYWQFSMTNVDGCDFDFDSFNAAAVVLSRRL